MKLIFSSGSVICDFSGSVLCDDDVLSIVKTDREKIEIKCTFSNTDKALKGKWCPNENGIFEWTVLSNGEQMTIKNLVQYA